MKMSSALTNVTNDCVETFPPYYNVTADDLMPICIRGTVYQVNISRVENCPNTRLYEIAKVWKDGRNGGSNNRPFYIDRNPYIFHCILDYYTTGELHLPDAFCSGQVKGELEYWGIGSQHISPCCLWKTRDGSNIYNTHL